ncbi:MAG: glycine cleavage system protein T [Candidatus Lambdaproteobacteria bacterium RIFOXYD2_FULL_50_16]|uniref:aminomethyltransferase n=1 Tax=Candidatus Lambdaproteobacteria bacterium RIFOXYD2_FULL_50_16 TaxID=1817772 RepID=A0A1F6GAZ9_9PROT|nr:MAG: glycine cleavage system protein T [Candidatus Lambdaproteobacteria bacterium RIFOXYD2_FULL_50_16]
MVDFSGWDMPIQYEGIIAEHMRTRQGASLFDVSHMGELYLEGKDALANLERLLPNRFGDMKTGQVRYSPMLYENGTFVDDLSVYRLCDDKFLLCVNASNKDKDHAWIAQNIKGEVVLTDKSDATGQIAIQGPKAEAILKKLVKIDLTKIGYWFFDWDLIDGKELLIARMGYTGEDGFEIFIDQEHTLWLWEKLMELGQEEGLQPAGLGARDTLRLEVAFPLYGQEIDDKHLALGCGMSRFMDLEKEFIGRSPLLAAQKAGLKEQLVKFVLVGKGVPRNHCKVVDLNSRELIGEVTSGSHSPVLSGGIGMAWIKAEHAQPGKIIGIEVRDRVLEAKLIQGSFVKTSKKA